MEKYLRHLFSDKREEINYFHESLRGKTRWSRNSIFGQFDQKLPLLPSYSLFCPPPPPPCSLVLQTVLLCQTKYSHSTLL